MFSGIHDYVTVFLLAACCTILTMGITANQVNLLNRFLFQHLQLPSSALKWHRRTDDITASSALFNNAGRCRRWGPCCPVQQTMCSHTVVPEGQLGRPVDDRLSSVNGTGLSLIRLPVNYRFPQTNYRFCYKNGFNIPIPNTNLYPEDLR